MRRRGRTSDGAGTGDQRRLPRADQVRAQRRHERGGLLRLPRLRRHLHPRPPRQCKFICPPSTNSMPLGIIFPSWFKWDICEPACFFSA
ncbi:unnamed protein product, partial [Musa textilis]